MARKKDVLLAREFKVRLEIGKHLMLLGNLAVGALVFGQAVSGGSFKSVIALAGILALGVLYTIALAIMRGGVK